MTFDRWLQLWALIMDNLRAAQESGVADEIFMFESQRPDLAASYAHRQEQANHQWAMAQYAELAAEHH